MNNPALDLCDLANYLSNRLDKLDLLSIAIEEIEIGILEIRDKNSDEHFSKVQFALRHIIRGQKIELIKLVRTFFHSRKEMEEYIRPEPMK